MLVGTVVFIFLLLTRLNPTSFVACADYAVSAPQLARRMLKK